MTELLFQWRTIQAIQFRLMCKNKYWRLQYNFYIILLEIVVEKNNIPSSLWTGKQFHTDEDDEQQLLMQTQKSV